MAITTNGIPELGDEQLTSDAGVSIPVADSAEMLDEGVQVAGLKAPVPFGLSRKILEPLTKRGATTNPEYKVKQKRGKPEPKEALDPQPTGTTPEPELEVQAPEPVSEQRMDELMGERAAQEGSARQAPSPSATQKAAGVEVGRANTQFYDSDGLAATIQAFAATTGKDIKSVTVSSLYDKAKASGVPERILDNIFKGIPLEGKIGDSELAIQLAGLQQLHDVSAMKVEEMMRDAALGNLDDLGKLQLREAMAQHQIIYASMRNAKTDVARAMNVFKGIKDTAKLSKAQIRAALDNLGGDDQLRALAEKYVDQKTQANKNKLLEVGVLRKTYDAIVYMNQSVLLTNPDTHIYNFAANAASLIMDVPERAAAIPIGALRKGAGGAINAVSKRLGLAGVKVSPDQYYGQDVYARTSAFYNGILDGWSLMGQHLKKGGKAKEVDSNPITADNFSDTPLVRVMGKEIRTGNLNGTLFGKMLDGMGLMYSIPFRGLGAGDEFTGGIAARMELHEQAWRYGATIYDAAVAAGSPHDEALAKAQKEVGTFLTERPAEIEASVDAWRKQATLTAMIDKETALGRTYWGAVKIMNHPLVKPITIFSKTVTNIGIEGAARIPILNFVSPRFYSEFSKGGRHRDLAISRLAVGGGIMLAGYKLAADGSVTGAGPSDTEDRNALRASGWQEFSKVFGEDEISPMNVRALQKLLGEDAVTKGTGNFAGKYFVSLKRLDPVNTPFLVSAALADAIKFQQYDPDDTLITTMINAGAAGLAEYSTSVPAMQGIAEFTSILGQKQTDGGDKFLAMVDAYARRTASFYTTRAAPIANIADSAIAGKIESLIDPASSSRTVTAAQKEWADDVLGIDATQPGIRAFFEAFNQMRAKVPLYNKDVLPKIDNYGNEVGTDKSFLWQPVRITAGKRNELAELLQQINHGIGNPRLEIDGVRLTAEQENRYKKLYAKEIKIDNMDMSERIIQVLDDMITEYEITDTKPNIGTMQSEVDGVVAQYRELARMRMFGKIYKGSGIRGDEYDYVLDPITGEPQAMDGLAYGLPDNRVEFPKETPRMVLNRNKKVRFGR